MIVRITNTTITTSIEVGYFRSFGVPQKFTNPVSETMATWLLDICRSPFAEAFALDK
jgi:hypothetical protein